MKGSPVPCSMLAAGQIEPAEGGTMFPVPIPSTHRRAQRQARAAVGRDWSHAQPEGRAWRNPTPCQSEHGGKIAGMGGEKSHRPKADSAYLRMQVPRVSDRYRRPRLQARGAAAGGE